MKIKKKSLKNQVNFRGVRFWLSCQQGYETGTQEKTKEMNGKMGL
jgi:hypothetical protein